MFYTGISSCYPSRFMKYARSHKSPHQQPLKAARAEADQVSDARCLPRRRMNIMSVEQTLAELVAIDSTSSRSNVEIVRFLAERAEGLGLCARLLPYTDAAGVKKLQMVAVWPRSTRDDEVIGTRLRRPHGHGAFRRGVGGGADACRA